MPMLTCIISFQTSLIVLKKMVQRDAKLKLFCAQNTILITIVHLAFNPQDAQILR